jgi:hypothetical protein
MKRLTIIITGFLICSASTCKHPFADTFTRLSVKNESSQDILFIVSLNYPDTTIPEKKDLYGVSPNQTRGKDYSASDWSDVFDRTSNDTLSVFIFSADTVDMVDWQQVRSQYNILKRYDLSQSDVETMQSTISYP